MNGPVSRREEAAILETFAVPAYLSLFGERVLATLADAEEARVCHLQCRSGYPDAELVARLPGVHVYGRDPSPHAIDLAKAKARTLSGETGAHFDYAVAEGYPLDFPKGAFSHAFALHPRPAERHAIVKELARLVAPHGQALLAMPLRGSFVEIADLLTECALKHDLPGLEKAARAAMTERPTDAVLEQELASAGFDFLEVDIRHRTLKFAGGRAFFEDPVTRLLLLPEFRLDPELSPGVDPLAYVREAIDKYWSEGTFELTVAVGVVSGRRR